MTDPSDHARLSDPGLRDRSLSGPEPFLRGILASGTLLLLALALEHLFFGRGYYASLVQHPFWIIVLLASLQGGLYTGVVTAGLAALMMDWPPRPIGTDITVHFVQVAMLPLQWLMAALFIGIFRQAELRRTNEVRDALVRQTEDNDLLATEILRADAARDRAELRVVTMQREAGFSTAAVEGLIALQNASAGDLRSRFKEVAALLSPRAAVLLLTRPNGGPDDTFRGQMRASLPAPVQADADLIETILSSGRAPILAAEVFESSGSFLTVAGISGTRDKTPSGAVVIFAAQKEEARALCPVADLLARSVEYAWRRSDRAMPQAQDLRIKTRLRA